MNKRGLGIFEIIILILGTISFSVIISSEFASGQTDCNSDCKNLNLEEDKEGAVSPDTCELRGSKWFDERGCCCKETNKVKEASTVAAAGATYKYLPGYLAKIGIKGTTAVIISNAVYAISLYYGTKAILKSFGASDEVSSSAAAGATGGYGTYEALQATPKVLTKYGLEKYLESGALKFILAHSNYVSLGVALIIFLASYEKTKTATIIFNCYSWQAPTTKSQSQCDECNKNELLGCSEYQCRSLGQGCEMWEGQCIWKYSHDSKYPIITLNESFLPDGYVYEPTKVDFPKDKGVKIKNTKSSDGCAPAYTPLTFGINTDEPAICKYDVVRQDDFKSMKEPFGGTSPSKTHIMILPIISIPESDGNYQIYVRCEDKNENSNPANFVFKFCVDKGPDESPPVIVYTSLLNNGYVAFGESSVEFIAYVNEPAICKWSYQDKSYDDMEKENTMTCVTDALEMNSQMTYPCSTTLTGLKDRQDNKFYFKCKDMAGNVNTESQPKEGFVLKGSQELVILSAGPNDETIKGPNENVKVDIEVETSAGANQGKAECSYSETGKDGSYIPFYYEDGKLFEHYKHTQTLYLTTGTYKYYLKCTDIGGNSKSATVSFDVKSDAAAPVVSRIYKEGTELILITNEEAECVYDTRDCNYQFKDGLAITTSDNIKHSLPWNTKSNYYIKCKDDYDNQPSPNECSIIVRPVV